MAASKFRVCATIAGELRNFMTVEARSNGDVIISPRWKPVSSAQRHVGEYPIEDLNIERGIRCERFSIHTSKESPREINIIKHTTEFDDGIKNDQVLVTEAIKKNNGFTHISTRRCPILNHEEHRFNGINSKIINIGNVEDDKFTLLYGTFISRKDRMFCFPIEDQYDIIQFPVNGFNIVILYTFLTISPHISSTEKIAFSQNPRDPATGMVELQCADQFRSHILELRADFLNTLNQEDISESAKWFAQHSRFFKVGVRNTRECQAWWQSLKPEHVARFGWVAD